MIEHSNYKYMGEGNFCWFVGIIEDIHDPLEAGRVKVRCFGFHSKNKEYVSTEHLPWAMVMSPTTSASISGIGSTPHGLVQGSQVVGFFQDGSDAQFPVILGTIPGVPQTPSDPSKGFNDPDGTFPLGDRIGSPDVNQLSGSSHAESIHRKNRTENLVSDIETSKGGTWSENDSQANPTYPNNHVLESTSGHIIEIDDSSDSERIHIKHSTGTYFEFNPDGSISRKTLGQDQEIITGNKNLLVNGSINVNSDSTANIRVQDKIHVKVIQGDIQIEILDGDANISIKGNANLHIDGNVNANIAGNMTNTVEGDMNNDVKGDYNVRANGKVSIRGSRIDLN